MNANDKALLNELGIDYRDFEYGFGYKTVARGKRYYLENRVLAISSQTTKDGLEIKGRVKGSGNAIYNCEVTVETDLFSTEVMSECNCPVYADCKHGVALLFYYLYEKNTIKNTSNKPKQTDTDKVSQWLDFIKSCEEDLQHEKSGFRQMEADNKSNKPQVIYILEYKEKEDFMDKTTGLAVRLYKARKLKNGGYGKEYKINYFREIEVNSYSNLFCTYLDEDIAAGLRSQVTSRYSFYELDTDIFLSGEHGEIILMQMLKTGRCFWKTQKSPPLKKGLQRNISLHWQEEKDYLMPRFAIEPAVEGIYRIENFYYYDANHQEFGLVEHETLKPVHILYFLEAPPIPRKAAGRVSKHLFDLLPEAEIPLPDKRNFDCLEIKVPPVCHLKLHAEPLQVDTGESRLLHMASLSFDYKGIIFKPGTLGELMNKTISTKTRNKKHYRITHDIDAQSKSLLRLKQAGLQSFDPELSPYGILDMAMFGECSISESVQKWDIFINNTLPELERDGWIISIDDSFSLQVEEINEWHAELEVSEGGDWFEMSLGFELDGKRVNMLPLIVDLIARSPNPHVLHQSLKEKDYELLQADDYKWIKVPSRRLLLIIDTVVELYDSSSLNKDGNLAFPKHAGLHYGDLLNDPDLKWKGGDELKALNNKIKNFTGVKKAILPKGLKASLRDYQKTGYNWLQFLREYQLNGILADDMGLGKTLQALVNLLKEKDVGRAKLPSLVIAPTSLMGNWKTEAQKFTPALKVLTLQGQDRKEKFSLIKEHDLVLTTYPLMIRDTDVYTGHAFHYLILDEAQAIKNAKSKTTQTIFRLEANHRLCLTGTPIENHLGELWSMFHFIMPGYLGSYDKFTKLFRTPIEKNGDAGRSEQLRKRVQPFLLRRTKDIVAKELPEKTEIIRTVALSGKQRDLYETVRLAMDKKVREEISKKSLARSHIMILDALLKLRQVCCDPQLVKLAEAKKVTESAKLGMLMEMVPEMVEEGRKILIFSQFTSMLSIIESALKKENISFSKLTGQTRKREEAINAFQNGEANVFLISLKAGGVGLNLTAADTVIHYDPWWNPAVENQATDRAYRIGQDKPVFVYKLLTENTVEEKILQLQEKKKNIADSMYKGSGGKTLALGQDELMDLLKPLE